MFSALRSFFLPAPPAAVSDTYIALVAQARNHYFFGPLGVPDTLDGRFELIVLHLFLLQHRLVVAPAENATEEGKHFALLLSEAFFRDMDRSLREIGVSDTGVSHRIKKMGKAYHGRLQAYALGLTDDIALRAAFARNLYGTVENGDVALLDQMAAYVHAMVAQLAKTEEATILAGSYPWPAPEALGR